ncbi:serine protease snake-like [Anopheles marshallii]|uniref:serine protease snake-like n=1 Tax=Anopheles marshallii TaxID=1521116 RepID=UPI00237A6A6E|nr:serine protease snake-like [Anopheles marshallii]
MSTVFDSVRWITQIVLSAIFISYALAAGNEGESCAYGNEPGICRGYTLCRPLLERSRIVKICGYTPQQAIVCCPVDYVQQLQQLNNPNQRTSERMCRKYQGPSSSSVLLGSLAVGSSVVKVKPRNQCPTDQNLIVGGTEARYGEFPHMARLAMPDENGNMAFRCGGTLISEQWVMTAAHCIESQTIKVRLGELKEGEYEISDPVDEQVIQIVKHPNYKSRTVYNDIALLQLANPVSFSTSIRPACLYTSPTVDRTKALAIGFGSTEAYGVGSKELLKVTLDVFTTPACAVFFQRNRRVPQGLLDTHLCAGYLAGGRDACTGDSGGPLQISTNDEACVAQIIGVTSFGIGCGSKTPGIYTRVSEYVSWIESIVWPTESGSSDDNHLGKMFNNLIVGGTEARYGEFPHMARLAMPDENGNMAFRCGGTLISEQWVMTAAHCIESQTIKVRLGELKEGEYEISDPVDEQVIQIVKHPNYKSRTVYNDIALLQLANPVSFSTSIRPACLYTSPTVDRTKALAIGFGSTEAYGVGSKELLKVTLDVFTTPACAVFFQRNRRVPQGLLDTHLCAGYLAGGRDACTGDSGGPLQISTNDEACVAQIIGVTSFGIGCGSKTPGIYTRVSEYVSWIESIVWPTESGSSDDKLRFS